MHPPPLPRPPLPMCGYIPEGSDVSPGISSLESRGQRREGKLPSENAKGEKTTPTLLFPIPFLPSPSPSLPFPAQVYKMCKSLLLLLLLMVLLFFCRVKEQFVYELDKNLVFFF